MASRLDFGKQCHMSSEESDDEVDVKRPKMEEEDDSEHDEDSASDDEVQPVGILVSF